MDLKGSKVIGGGDDHILLQHPDGHEIKIMHKNTSHKHTGDIRAYADGGEVAEKKPQQPQQSPVNPQDAANIKKAFTHGYADGTPDGVVGSPADNADQGVPEAAAMGAGLGVGSSPDTGMADQSYLEAGLGRRTLLSKDAIPEAQRALTSRNPSTTPQDSGNPILASNAQQSQTPQGDLFGMDALSAGTKQGIGNEITGINKGAAAQGQLGSAEAKALQSSQKQQADIQAHFQEQFDSINQDRSNLIEDIANHHIDPSHYVGSMSTVGKVATGIGLILGGLGSGLNGGPNQALEMLNKQIDRDIDAQKAQLGIKETLLSANMKQFGNIHDATAMARVNQMDILSNQLQQAAAQSQDPLAKARAQQAVGEIQQKTAPIVSQIAQRQAIFKGVQAGQVPPAVQLRMLPEKDQKEAGEALGKYQETADLQKLYQKSFNDVHSKFMNGLLSPNDTASAKDVLKGKLSHATAGRYNQDEAEKLVNAMFPSKTDVSEDTIRAKLTRGNELFRTLEAEHKTTLDRFGIQVPDVQTSTGFNKR